MNSNCCNNVPGEGFAQAVILIGAAIGIFANVEVGLSVIGVGLICGLIAVAADIYRIRKRSKENKEE